MQELYTDSVEPVRLQIWYNQVPATADSSVNVQIFDEDNNLVFAGPAVGPGDDMEYKFQMPSSLLEDPAEYTLRWEYAIDGALLTKRESLSVVQPYVLPEVFTSAFPGFAGISYDSLKDMERTVRYTINSFCGQEFILHPGLWKTVYIAPGNQLYLPERLVRLRTAQSGPWNVSNFVYPDETGYVLHYASMDGYVNVKADIGIPGSPRMFGVGDPVRIYGDWGWQKVPFEVQHAAQLLMARYLEPESEWHRNRVESVNAGDHKLTFTKNPYTSTGDNQVDQILEKFKLFQPGAV